MTNEEYLHFVEATFAEMAALVKRKNNDYTAGSGDALYNLRDAESLGLQPMQGLVLRMGDKFNRIKTFIKKGSLQVVNEGAEDAFKDLIGYSLMGLALLDEQRATSQAEVIVTTWSKISSNTKEMLGGRDKPVSAGNQEVRRKPGHRRNPQVRDPKSGKFRRSAKR